MALTLPLSWPPSSHRADTRAAGGLRLPPGCTAQTLSDPSSRDAVTRWLRQSPDHTVYHLAPYLDFARTQDRHSEVFLISREGAPQFALPVHSWTGAGVDSGYTGVVLPPTRREGTLRRSVATLAELLSVNRHLSFRFHQSAQAPAYEDSGRAVLLQRLLEGEGLPLEPIYGRLCGLEALAAPGAVPTTDGSRPHARRIDSDWLTTAEALGGCEPAARNKIRQAVRDGLVVEYARAGEPDARASAYASFEPLHEELWRRTGLLPKPPGYWQSLSASIVAGAGEDLVVLVLDAGGEPLAGVVCHAYQGRAIYWSGCSSRSGLRARANPLCLHGAMAACRQFGVSTFELGRFRADEPSSKVRAITEYKAQFGGELVRVTTFTSVSGVVLRARTARAAAASEARRRLSVAIGRARARANGASS